MKKNVVLILFTTALVLAAGQAWVTLDPQFTDSVYSVTILHSDYDSTIIEFGIPGFYYIDTTVGGQEYRMPILPPGCISMGDSGKPYLPVIREIIGIPPQKAVELTVVQSADTVFEDWVAWPTIQIADTMPPDSTGATIVLVRVFGIDSSFYLSSETAPLYPYGMSMPFALKDIRTVSLSFQPFQYYAGDSSITVHKQMRIKLAYGGVDSVNVFPDGAYDVSSEMVRAYSSSICNYTYLTTVVGDRTPKYWVVAHKAWEDEIESDFVLDSWLKYRHMEGYEVELITTGDFDAPLTSTDIRAVINDNCAPDDYIVIWGDRGSPESIDKVTELDWGGRFIAGRDFFFSPFRGPETEPEYEQTFAYRCTDEDKWLPDLNYGRIPVENLNEEFRYFIENIHTYESGLSGWGANQLVGVWSKHSHYPCIWGQVWDSFQRFTQGITRSEGAEVTEHALGSPLDGSFLEIINEDLQEVLYNGGDGFGILMFMCPMVWGTGVDAHINDWAGDHSDGFTPEEIDWGRLEIDGIAGSQRWSGFGIFSENLGHHGIGYTGHNVRSGTSYGNENNCISDYWMFRGGSTTGQWLSGFYCNMAHNALILQASWLDEFGTLVGAGIPFGKVLSHMELELINSNFAWPPESAAPWDPTAEGTSIYSGPYDFSYNHEELMASVVLSQEFIGDPATVVFTDGPYKMRIYPNLYGLIFDYFPPSVYLGIHVYDGPTGTSPLDDARICVWKEEGWENTSGVYSGGYYPSNYKMVGRTSESGTISFEVTSWPLSSPGLLHVTATKHNYGRAHKIVIVGYPRSYTGFSSSRPSFFSMGGWTGDYPADVLFDKADSAFVFAGNQWMKLSDETIEEGAVLAVFSSDSWEDTAIVLPSDTLEYYLEAGWNLVGGAYSTINWDGNFSSTSEILCGPIVLDTSCAYKFIDDDSVYVSEGYWVYVETACTLIFPSVGNDSNYIAQNWNYLRDIPNPPHIQDTAHFSVSIDWSNDSVTITHKETGNPVADAIVVVENGVAVEHKYTSADGKAGFGIDINKSDSCWIFVHKIGFVDYTVHPYGEIQNGERLRGDVYLYGDIVVSRDCTLFVEAGTNIYFKPTSADWNFPYGMSNKTELMVYTGHLIVEGEPGNLVRFRPASGGSGMYQWGGLWAKDQGSFDVRYAQFDSCDGVAAVQGAGGPGRCRLVRTRHIGNQGVYGDWRSAHSPSGWLQMDSCYVEGRAMWYQTQDSCWARACSLKGSPSVGESYYVSSCPNELKIEDCYIFGYSARGGRLYGQTEFRNCLFDGTSAGAYIYSDGADFYNCEIDANSGNYGLYIANTATSNGFDVDSTRFYNFSYAGVYSSQNAEFEKHNCFIRSGAPWTFYSQAVIKIVTDSCYFDSFAIPVKGIIIDSSNNVSECIPDTSLSKLYADNGRPILPKEFSLGNAVPNPFNASVAMEIDIPKAAKVSFEVYDLLGNRVITLLDEDLERGRYRLVWNGRDSRGREMPSGTYFYRLRTEDFEQTKKMTLLK